MSTPIPTAPSIPPTDVKSYSVAVMLEINQRWQERDAAQRAEIARLTALIPKPTPTVGRFPGDPGQGKILVGTATGLGSITDHRETESMVGVKLAFRQYNNKGISDFAVPEIGQKPTASEHPIAYKAWRDISEGRVAVVSGKPGIEALAAHQYGPQLVKFFRYLFSLDGIVVVCIHHEPENDWKTDAGKIDLYKTHQAAFRESQVWVRTCIAEAERQGGKANTNVAFMGSIMSYSWTADAVKKFGDPNGWNPGKQANGKHVWDACGLDHYEGSYTITSLETKKWKDAVASVVSWGCNLGVFENGVSNGNPNGGKVLGAFLGKLAALGCVIYLYFDSHAGPGGVPQEDPRDWWNLTEANGTLQAFTEFVRNVGFNPNEKTG